MTLIRAGIQLLLIAALASCGFHLRGTGGQAFSVDTIHVGASNAYGELQRELESALKQSGASIVPESAAPYIVSLIAERLTRRPVSTTTQISVSEYELRMEVVFEVSDGDGEVILPASALSVERIYRFDNQSLVGSSEEESLLSEEMRREVVGNIIRQIDAAIRGIQNVSK